jgi:FKBP-type peptidyl-prolyl cis-trans isomerase FkpA
MRNVVKPAGIVSMSLILLGLLLGGCLEEDIDYAAREKKEREKYLEENNITVEPTESGLYFIPLDTGYGDYAEMGDSVTINFEGYLLDGSLLTTNIEAVAVEYDLYNPYETYEPYTFVLGEGHMIDGIEEGLTYMREGASAKMIIPSALSFPGSYRSLLYYVNFLDLVQPPD